MFNNSPDRDTLSQIGAALARAGTTAWLPTFITDTVAKMRLAAQAIVETFGTYGVAGVHFEGPHISVQRKGAHREPCIQPIHETTLQLVKELRDRRIPVLMTLAPEQQPAGSIAQLCSMGVVVSLGHTAADRYAVEAALAEGATSFTHLFNGMTPMSSRDPGVVGTALDSDAWCGVIVDGHHVDDKVLRIAIRSRPTANRMVVVSDAMATTHGPDYFELYGETIRLVEGKLINQAGSLAGAHIDMAQSLVRLTQMMGIAPSQALRMTSSNAAEMMGLQGKLGKLSAGFPLNAVLLDARFGLQETLAHHDFLLH